MFASAHPFASPQQTRHRPPIRVLVVDDARCYREVVVSCLNDEEDIEVAGEAGDGESAIAEALRLRPDVVLMDINMPGLDGIEATRAILAHLPRVAVIGLSMHGEAEMEKSMRDAGAARYLSKGGDADTLLQAIRDCR